MRPPPSADDIWIVNFGDPIPGETAKSRPAFVVSVRLRSHVFIVPLTTTRRELDHHVEIEPTASTGLRELSYAQCEKFRSVPVWWLDHKLGEAPPDIGWVIRDHLVHLTGLT